MTDKAIKALIVFLVTLGFVIIGVGPANNKSLSSCLANGFNDHSLGYCTHPAKDPVLLSEVEL